MPWLVISYQRVKTPGEALDALTVQLSEEETSTLVIVQTLHPDRFFNAEQQKRLADLMNRWRVARDKGESLTADEQSELEALVEAELRASTDRTAALADVLSSCPPRYNIPYAHNHPEAFK